MLFILKYTHIYIRTESDLCISKFSNYDLLHFNRLNSICFDPQSYKYPNISDRIKTNNVRIKSNYIFFNAPSFGPKTHICNFKREFYILVPKQCFKNYNFLQFHPRILLETVKD